MNPKKPNSIRSIAKRHNTTHTTIQNLKNEGLDISDDSAISTRLLNFGSILPKRRSNYVPSESNELGMTGAIERLRETEVCAYLDYLEGLKSNPSTSPKLWISTVDALVKAESANPDIEEQNKATISKTELALIIGPLFADLRLDLDAFPRRFANLTEGKNSKQREAIAAKEFNRITEYLFACKLLKP